MNTGKLWNLKKHIFPKCRDPPTAMVDPETGNILTSEKKIEDAAIKVYKERLRNRPMKENMQQIKDAKELLCEKFKETKIKGHVWTSKRYLPT